MAIRDFNNPMGLLGLNNNPTGSLGLSMSPILEARAKQAEEEEATRKRSERFSKLRNFADSLQAMNAGQSGNFGAQNQFLNNIDKRRAEEAARAKAKADKLNQEKLLASLPPEAQRIYELFGKQAAYNYIYNKPKGSEKRIVKGADGFNYYMDGTRVLPGVETSPEKEKRTTIKGADGFNYYMDGTRVLPNVIGKENKSDRKYEKAADGFYRYIDGDKEKVFGEIEIPKEPPFKITTSDVLGSQKEEKKTFEAANKGVKNFQQLLDAASAADGAASYALMIKFIKQLDDSVVREGEVATFGGFQGALTNLKNQISKTSGEGFTPTVKSNMINLAAQTANRLVNDYNVYKQGKAVSYGAIGFDPNMVFAGLDFNLGDLDLTREYQPKDFEFIELD